MCIIVSKPKGIDVPEMNVLKNCFVNNSDGCGFAYNHNGKVIIKKGFMEFEDFKQELKKVGNLKEKGIVFHFRITTHGFSIKANTHPFPIDNKLKQLQALRISTDLAMAHNGIISSVNVSYKGNKSDTMAFIAEQVAYMKEIDSEFYKNVGFQNLMLSLSHSKLSFIDKEGDIYNLGDFIEDDGVFYSNTSYKTRTYYSGLYSYDYDDYYESEETGMGYIKLRSLPEDAIIMLSGSEFKNDYYEFLIDAEENLYMYSDYKYKDVEFTDNYSYCSNYAYEDLEGHKDCTESWFVYNIVDGYMENIKRLSYGLTNEGGDN